MRKNTWLPALLVFLAASTAGAFPFVTAMPSYFDFGELPPGRVDTRTVVFFNQSPEYVPFFNVYCGGDIASFRCYSNCWSLQPYGSCTVHVQFMPRNGDGMRRIVWLNGSGSGAFATSTGYGTDKKPEPVPSPTPTP
jgi:hypothetical protein